MTAAICIMIMNGRKALVLSKFAEICQVMKKNRLLICGITISTTKSAPGTVENASNMTFVGMNLAPVVTVVMEIEALELRKVHTFQRKIALLQCISVSMTLYSNQQSCYSKIRTVRVASKDLTVQNME